MNNIEHRLIEWCRWRTETPCNYWPSVSPTGKMVEEGIGASHSSSQANDGGMGAMVDRMHAAIKHDLRCRDMQDAISQMPELYASFIRATFIGHWRDVPRPRRAAIVAMGCTEAEYRDIRSRTFGWLEAMLNLVHEAA